MRFALSVVVLAVCIVVLQYTANATDDPEGSGQRSEGLGDAVVATTTTTAAQKVLALGSTTEEVGRESTTKGDLQTDHQTEEAAAEPAAQPAAKTITTTTTVNVVAPQVDNQLDNAKTQQQLAAEPEPEVEGADKTGEKEKPPVNVDDPREAAPIVEDAEAAAQKTKTTTASVNSLPLSDNSQTREQTSRTTTAVQTNSSPPSTRERKVAPGGPEPGKKNVGEQEKTTGDQSSSRERGAHASVPGVKDAAVTHPTSIVKKNNGANTGLQPNKNSKDKETHQKKTPDATTTITEEQKDSTETSTTSSTAPTKETSGMTSTLPKGFKIPQSMDKTDGISSVSLWFALATLIPLAAFTGAPMH